MSNLSLVLVCLRELELEEAVVSLDGSGDSGDATFDSAVTRAGETLYQLPTVTVLPTRYGNTLDALVRDVASNAPDGNWYDNEGGYGTVTFYPFAADSDDTVVCDMTYRDEYPDEESGFDDDDDVDALEEPDQESDTLSDDVHDHAARNATVPPTITFQGENTQ